MFGNLMDVPDADEASSTDTDSSPGCASAFLTTHWSVVQSAASNDPDCAMRALEYLCGRYWYPIYAFVRRRGSDAHEAEDLTQAFFTHLLEKESLKQVDRQKGKFRTFLLTSLTNFLANEWDKKQTLKRGGKQHIISLDENAAEARYQCEPIDWGTPEKMFERRWALTLLHQVLDQLKTEYARSGKAESFEKLEPFITGEMTIGSYERLAVELAMKEETVRVAVSRMRRRFGELLRREIAQTVSDPVEIDMEIRDLFAAISRDE
jgi:RNA polymerase sigma-70 factor (ECF subfamily)